MTAFQAIYYATYYSLFGHFCLGNKLTFHLKRDFIYTNKCTLKTQKKDSEFMIDNYQFEKGLVTPLAAALKWRWKDIRIQTRIHIPGKDEMPVYRSFRPTDPEKRYLEVFVHFPADYLQEEPRWTELATPIPQICTAILYSLGLQVFTCDAIVDTERQCYTFCTEINERVFQNLPAIPKVLTNREYQEHFS